MNQPIRLILILIAGLLLAACESIEPGLEKLDNTFLKRDPQVLINAGAKRLTADEARSHVSGNTEFWEAGPVYYDPDGKLELIWHKVKSDGSWDLNAEGEVCLSAPTWTNCHHYLALDGVVTTVMKGKTRGVQPVKTGKHSAR